MYVASTATPTNSKVAAAWLATVTPLAVVDTLPSAILPGGMVRYQTIASTPDPNTGASAMRSMRVQIDVYRSGSTQTPPWAECEADAEAIVRNVPLFAPDVLAGLPGALINEARISDGPVRSYGDRPMRSSGDASALARVTLDAILFWTPIS